jgi:hypothetical protein
MKRVIVFCLVWLTDDFAETASYFARSRTGPTVADMSTPTPSARPAMPVPGADHVCAQILTADEDDYVPALRALGEALAAS